MVIPNAFHRLALVAIAAFALTIPATGLADDARSDVASGGATAPSRPDEPSASTEEAGVERSIAEDVVPEALPERPNAREASLAGVLAARRRLEEELLDRQALLGSDAARGREGAIEAEIRALSDELTELDRNFSELAAGVDPVSIEDEESPEQLNLTNEVRTLLAPLINELKRATSRPREIDRLRTEIAQLGERLALIGRAKDRLAKVRTTVSDPTVLDALDEELRDWERRRGQASTSLKVAEQKLALRRGESQSFTEAVENVFQIFFKSRGRNLLIALVASAGFVFAIRRLRVFLARRPTVSRRASSFQGRVFGLVYSVFAVVGAILVFLICLYLFGDWVLLILVLLLILGLIWTSKQAIPQFWKQTVLILDMGVVRQGERVVYNGLPWRVDSISFYSDLSNPALVGGEIRLPIDDLSELRSRRHHPDEPWFPTETGDIVLLDDGNPARVEFQSIEAVHLREPGGRHSIVPAAEFTGQRVEKLSDGYRVDITFGLDYGDQAEITTTMRDAMERGIDARWRESRWSESLVSLSVEFAEAGASSLDYFVRVDLDGSVAFDLQAQKRALARFCVDICNEHGWVIPFTQLTLHVAGSEPDASAPDATGPISLHESTGTETPDRGSVP